MSDTAQNSSYNSNSPSPKTAVKRRLNCDELTETQIKRIRGSTEAISSEPLVEKQMQDICVKMEELRVNSEKKGEAVKRKTDSCIEEDDDFPSNPKQPKTERELFTFKELQMICEATLREREVEMRECYEKVLTIKLAEQYDSFIIFHYDFLLKQDPPSYIN